MKRHRLTISGILLLGMILLSGCGVKNDYITINYAPLSGVQRVRGVEAVTVKVQGVDERRNKENVGKKGYEYDFLGAIITQNDIPDTANAAKAIQSELQMRGFTVGDGGVC